MTDPLNKTADLSALRIDRAEERTGPGRFVFPIVATLLVLAAGAAFFWARAHGGIALRAPEVSITRVALVTPTQASTVLTASGYIVARSKAEISPKSVGRVAWLHLEEGQRVKKGELVARLESQELTAQKNQVLANLENARREKVRAKAMFDQKIGTQQAYDATEAAERALTAQVRYFDEQIKNAEIYAPIDGVVTVKKAFVGETVSPQGFGGAGSGGATFAVIVDLKSLEMEADINEQNLSKLSQEQPAEVMLDAYPDQPYKARLRQIVPTADRQKGSVKVKIELLSKDDKVLPEMSCRVVFLNPQAKVDEKARPKVMVPTSSIVTVGDGKGVLLVDSKDESATFRPLVLGVSSGAQTEVTSGAAGGEEIVADAASAKSPWHNTQKIRLKKE